MSKHFYIGQSDEPLHTSLRLYDGLLKILYGFSGVIVVGATSFMSYLIKLCLTSKFDIKHNVLCFHLLYHKDVRGILSENVI